MSSPIPLNPDQQPNQPPVTPGTPGSNNSIPFPSGNTSLTSWEDPSGAWQKFLSKSGTPASPEQVKQFFHTLLKFFTTLIQRSDRAHQRAMQELKKVADGDG